jgi:hypothetical protein
MTIKELFEGPVGDYCIARNTIKCLFVIQFILIRPDVSNSVFVATDKHLRISDLALLGFTFSQNYLLLNKEHIPRTWEKNYLCFGYSTVIENDFQC